MNEFEIDCEVCEISVLVYVDTPDDEDGLERQHQVGI